MPALPAIPLLPTIGGLIVKGALAVPKIVVGGMKLAGVLGTTKTAIDVGGKVITNPREAIDDAKHGIVEGAENVGNTVKGLVTSAPAAPWLLSGSDTINKEIANLPRDKRNEIFKDLGAEGLLNGAQNIAYVADKHFRDFDFEAVGGKVFAGNSWQRAVSNAKKAIDEVWSKKHHDNPLLDFGSKIWGTITGGITGFLAGFTSTAQNNVEDAIIEKVNLIEKELIASGAPEFFIKDHVRQQILDQAKQMAKDKSFGAITLDFDDNIKKALAQKKPKSEVAQAANQAVQAANESILKDTVIAQENVNGDTPTPPGDTPPVPAQEGQIAQGTAQIGSS